MIPDQVKNPRSPSRRPRGRGSDLFRAKERKTTGRAVVSDPPACRAREAAGAPRTGFINRNVYVGGK